MAPNHKSVKLYYFAGRGRAEHIRQLLKLANVKFEDVIIEQETWPTFKDDMPLGQVPVLEVDGVKIGQSLAISRFIAHEYGLAGENALENARLDMIADLVQDATYSDGIKLWPMVLLGFIQVPDKEAYFKEKVRPSLDNYASLFEKFLVENGNQTLLGGDKVTWVDVLAAEFFSKFVDFGEKDCLEAYPHIQNLIDRIHNLPAIRKHIDARSKTLA
ncbi:putative glutathione S-transferase gst-36 [Ditylenchus destructor]|uniref:glutathione transferase n=1 Tax=Ditylenchus destructor TaxID=166010 RepID=A0AAD4R673_9BILA|nr:putative glutathione S-transferase gst-36 [Ditylenchus destructor]